MSRIQVACDLCTRGVMARGNPHLHGLCNCGCHKIPARENGNHMTIPYEPIEPAASAPETGVLRIRIRVREIEADGGQRYIEATETLIEPVYRRGDRARGRAIFAALEQALRLRVGMFEHAKRVEVTVES